MSAPACLGGSARALRTAPGLFTLFSSASTVNVSVLLSFGTPCTTSAKWASGVAGEKPLSAAVQRRKAAPAESRR